MPRDSLMLGTKPRLRPMRMGLGLAFRKHKIAIQVVDSVPRVCRIRYSKPDGPYASRETIKTGGTKLLRAQPLTESDAGEDTSGRLDAGALADRDIVLSLRPEGSHAAQAGNQNDFAEDAHRALMAGMPDPGRKGNPSAVAHQFNDALIRGGPCPD